MFQSTICDANFVHYGIPPLPIWQTRGGNPRIFKRDGIYVCALGGFTADGEKDFYGIEACHDTPLKAYYQLAIYMSNMTVEWATAKILELESK